MDVDDSLHIYRSTSPERLFSISRYELRLFTYTGLLSSTKLVREPGQEPPGHPMDLPVSFTSWESGGGEEALTGWLDGRLLRISVSCSNSKTLISSSLLGVEYATSNLKCPSRWRWLCSLGSRTGVFASGPSGPPCLLKAGPHRDHLIGHPVNYGTLQAIDATPIIEKQVNQGQPAATASIVDPAKTYTTWLLVPSR